MELWSELDVVAVPERETEKTTTKKRPRAETAAAAVDRVEGDQEVKGCKKSTDDDLRADDAEFVKARHEDKEVQQAQRAHDHAQRQAAIARKKRAERTEEKAAEAAKDELLKAEVAKALKEEEEEEDEKEERDATPKKKKPKAEDKPKPVAEKLKPKPKEKKKKKEVEEEEEKPKSKPKPKEKEKKKTPSLMPKRDKPATAAPKKKKVVVSEDDKG